MGGIFCCPKKKKLEDIPDDLSINETDQKNNSSKQMIDSLISPIIPHEDLQVGKEEYVKRL